MGSRITRYAHTSIVSASSVLSYMPIRSLATYIRSASATALNTLVSLSRKITLAHSEGTAVASAWGRIT